MFPFMFSHQSYVYYVYFYSFSSIANMPISWSINYYFYNYVFLSLWAVLVNWLWHKLCFLFFVIKHQNCDILNFSWSYVYFFLYSFTSKYSLCCHGPRSCTARSWFLFSFVQWVLFATDFVVLSHSYPFRLQYSK